MVGGTFFWLCAGERGGQDARVISRERKEMRILSGIQPSGKLLIGNYFGMMRPALELQQKGDAHLFIADDHALT